MRRSSIRILAAVCAAGWATLVGARELNLPSVEIFSNQLPILIRRGEARTLTLTGAVYDHPFSGSITFAPNGPTATACPIFLNGDNPFVGFPVGPNSVAVALSVYVPPATPPGTYNCALKYSADYQILTIGDFEVGKGNQVNIGYTVKRR